jgi:hypothetical protein
MSRSKILAAIGLVLFAISIYIAASPYITVYQMKSAAERHDGEALSEHIEFPSVRQSLKDQMNAMIMKEMAKDEMKDNPFAALGAAFGGFMVDKMVEAYVTPTGITGLMAGEQPKLTEGGESTGSSARKPLSDASMSYESLNKFVVKVKGDNGEEARFVLRRRGISWKLTEIIMPLEKASPLSSFTAPSPSPAVETKAPLELVSWDARPTKGEYANYYEITITLKNNSDKDIKLIDATVQFADLLGSPIYAIKVSPDHLISAGETITDSNQYEINQFMPEQARLAQLKKEDVKATIVVSKLVFTDNTIGEYAPRTSLEQPTIATNPSVKESGTPQDSSEGISDWGKRVLAQSEQQDGEDAEFKRAASEIASARIHQALHQYWNDQDGFSLSPMDLQYVVSKFDTERIKKLDEEHSTIWKSVDPIFADHYCQLQAPVNDKHLKDLQAVRRLITEGINEAVDARGSGSASHMLLVFGAAETEWILRQLYRSSAP